MNFYEEAIKYTRLGWRVFPLQAGTKIPWPKTRGVLEATNDENIVSDWAERWPDSNIGIACGASNLMVVDFDPRNGCWEQLDKWAREGKLLPLTVHARTRSGGLHLFFSMPNRLPDGWKRKLPGGVDIQVGNKYIVAAPSIITSTGVDDGQAGSYRWEREPMGPDLPLPPRWLMELLRPAPVKAFVGKRAEGDVARRLEGALAKVAGCNKGGRNHTLNLMAHLLGRALVEDGVSQVEWEPRFLEAALSCGLELTESRKTIASGIRSGMRHAGQGQKSLPGLSSRA